MENVSISLQSSFDLSSQTITVSDNVNVVAYSFIHFTFIMASLKQYDNAVYGGFRAFMGDSNLATALLVHAVGNNVIVEIIQFNCIEIVVKNLFGEYGYFHKSNL